MQSIKMLTTAAGPDYSFQAGVTYHGVDDELAAQLLAAGAAEPAKDPRRAHVEVAASPAPETAAGRGARTGGKSAKAAAKAETDAAANGADAGAGEGEPEKGADDEKAGEAE